MRILGIDDGPFSRGMDRVCPIVGVLMRLDGKLEQVVSDSLTVDGDDVSEKVSGLIERLRIRPSVVMAEGITFAGFNILDPGEFYEVTGIPFMSVRKGKPDLTAMIMAIRKHDKEALKKENILKRISPDYTMLGGSEVVVNYAGMSLADAKRLILRASDDGILPEPVRVAHIVASTLYEYAHRAGSGDSGH
ncbi:MAG: DUF99 family protein [Thermoplasmataceae archaeon]